MRGRVDSFDSPRGLGVIVAADGTEYPFHCTQLADRSREIDPGTEVDFEVVAGPLGRWEAGAIRRVAA